MRSVYDPSFALIPTWAFAFVVTEAIEIPIYRLALTAKRHRWLRASVPSAVTHPLLWFAFPLAWSAFAPLPRFDLSTGQGVPQLLAYGALGEGAAVLIEAVLLRRLGGKRPLTFSLVANGASAATGLVAMLFS